MSPSQSAQPSCAAVSPRPEPRRTRPDRIGRRRAARDRPVATGRAKGARKNMGRVGRCAPSPAPSFHSPEILNNRSPSTLQAIRLVPNHFLCECQRNQPRRGRGRPAMASSQAFMSIGLARRIGRATHALDNDGGDEAASARRAYGARIDPIVTFVVFFASHLPPLALASIALREIMRPYPALGHPLSLGAPPGKLGGKVQMRNILLPMPMH